MKAWRFYDFGDMRLDEVPTPVRPEPLELAAELGADHCIDASTTDAVEAVRELTGGRGADVVIESAGG